jgi:hypothetical protein
MLDATMPGQLAYLFIDVPETLGIIVAMCKGALSRNGRLLQRDGVCHENHSMVITPTTIEWCHHTCAWKIL